MADISNNVVAVLLILVIAVSAIGTWAFLTAFEPVGPSEQGSSTGQAEVRLDINAPPAPQHAETQAVIALAIAEEQ